MDLRSLIKLNWGISPTKVKPINNGLINQTWLVSSSHSDYILQQVNTTVFQNPLLLQKQLISLTQNLSLPHLVPLEFVPKKNGKWILESVHGTFRMMKAITPSIAFSVPNVQLAQLAAMALMEFHEACQNQIFSNWQAPIDQFLDVDYRIQSYLTAKNTATSSRRFVAKIAIELLENEWSSLLSWQKLAENSPQVLIHADPKLGNFLFHPNGKEVRALIDWDTIQLGTVFYDFGDMIRSFCSNSEDENDAQSVFKSEIFEVLIKTFKVDPDKLYVASKGVILIQALRFLTDFLEGDIYYKVEDEQHNLRRSINQLTLASELKNYWITTRMQGH